MDEFTSVADGILLDSFTNDGFRKSRIESDDEYFRKRKEQDAAI